MKKIKPFLQWFILGITLFFILNSFKTHWQEIRAVKFDQNSFLILFLALIVTMIAHIFSGFVWHKILKNLGCYLTRIEVIKVYLITNIAKYLPGNIWHFYGRINVITNKGYPLPVATLAVLLEPLLIAASALLVALISSSLGIIKTTYSWQILTLEIIILIITLIAIHPHFINPVLQKLSKSKSNTKSAMLQTYPLTPLVGQLIFLLLRGSGFLLVFFALNPFGFSSIPILLSVFSFAYFLGLIVPGAPGGMGIFEGTAIATLSQTDFSAAMILTTVALYRIISILAELITAFIASQWKI